jgi:hypothetical protein
MNEFEKRSWERRALAFSHANAGGLPIKFIMLIAAVKDGASVGDEQRRQKREREKERKGKHSFVNECAVKSELVWQEQCVKALSI